MIRKWGRTEEDMWFGIHRLAFVLRALLSRNSSSRSPSLAGVHCPLQTTSGAKVNYHHRKPITLNLEKASPLRKCNKNLRNPLAQKMDPPEERKLLEAKSKELEALEKKLFGRRQSDVAETLSRVNINQAPSRPIAVPARPSRIPAREDAGREAPVHRVSSKKADPDSPAYAPTPKEIIMKTNYFLVALKENWELYQYYIDISPEVEGTFRRKILIRNMKKGIFGDNFVYIFDGISLMSPALIVEDTQSYSVVDEKDNMEYNVRVTLVKKASRDDSVYNQVYNLILRRCMFALGLDEIGRNFYDRKNYINIPDHRVQLWPGYVTSIRQYDDDVLLCVEITHRVLRNDSILNILNGMKKLRNFKEIAGGDLRHSIIMTQYNKKTYKVEDIDWTSNPKSCFERKGENISYIAYYKEAYNEEIQDETQPLLICRPTKRESRKKGADHIILLVPELCQITGLSDSMRANMTLMKALASHLHMSPENRAREAENFVLRFMINEKVQEYLSEWKLEICPELIRCPFNILKKESIFFADGVVDTNAQVDWTPALRNRKMLKVKELKNWIIITPSRDKDGVNNLVRTTIKVAAALDFTIHPPKIVEMVDTNISSYMAKLHAISLPVDLVFFILPGKSAEPYTTIKRFLTVDLGVPSQGFTSKNLSSKGIMSIVTKVVIQINAKLGGEPWGVKIPLKNLMVVGIDVQKCGRGSVGTLVASNSPSLTGYFSYVTEEGEDYSNGLLEGIKCAIDNYNQQNGTYPERIIIFRDSISEGQDEVLEKEAKSLMVTFKDYYDKKDAPLPKFAYVACSRKSGTRLFAENVKTDKMYNPEAGTVVQEKITEPKYPTFFLVAPTVRQGCIAPCCYKVLYDSSNLTPDKMQVLVYKLCHLYYNWSGTVGLPSPSQYCRKLAFVAANVLRGSVPNPKLANSLHFL